MTPLPRQLAMAPSTLPSIDPVGPKWQLLVSRTLELMRLLSRLSRLFELTLSRGPAGWQFYIEQSSYFEVEEDRRVVAGPALEATVCEQPVRILTATPPFSPREKPTPFRQCRKPEPMTTLLRLAVEKSIPHSPLAPPSFLERDIPQPRIRVSWQTRLR